MASPLHAEMPLLRAMHGIAATGRNAAVEGDAWLDPQRNFLHAGWEHALGGVEVHV